MTNDRQHTGEYGEQLACQYLKKSGYTLVETNWHSLYGEIDIVARKTTELVFVEVRTRRARTTETSFASITPAKRHKMIQAAYAYLNTHNLPDETRWRIDVLAIALPYRSQPIIEHMENALDW